MIIREANRLLRKQLTEPTAPDFKRYQLETPTDNTLRVTLSRLKKRGLVKIDNKIWGITQKGRSYLKNKISKATIPHFTYSTSLKRKEKNIIIAFDIPETYRKKRDWLRIEIISLGFIPLQKSVWFGPAPLPKEFIKFLDELKIIKFIKFLEAKEKDLI